MFDALSKQKIYSRLQVISNVINLQGVLNLEVVNIYVDLVEQGSKGRDIELSFQNKIVKSSDFAEKVLKCKVFHQLIK